MAYSLDLAPTIKVHDVFHVSFLKKYARDYNHVIDQFVLEMEPKGYFYLESLCTLDQRSIMLHYRALDQVKVQWKHFGLEETTWEMTDAMNANDPFLFVGGKICVYVYI